MRTIAWIIAGIVTLLLLLQLPTLLPRLGDRLIFGGISGSEPPLSCPEGMLFIPTEDSGFCIDRFEAPNIEGKLPLRGLSMEQALEYCAQRGSRLCTEGEWYRACSGPQGNASYIGECVNPSSEPQMSGSRTHCFSPEGVADLSGNILEWTSDGQPDPFAFFLKGGSYLTPDGYTSCGYQVVVLPGQSGLSRPDLGVRCCR
ncbi:MAG: SUMF1/EgtB/PvdO family nonheme iron enzyme [Candidatus Alcyoniella australis]|nr:SUMF1/EgtB/PvdO family nonheme iron enzyme [Candidatus Alcyoniella australis]